MRYTPGVLFLFSRHIIRIDSIGSCFLLKKKKIFESLNDVRKQTTFRNVKGESAWKLKFQDKS